MTQLKGLVGRGGRRAPSKHAVFVTKDGRVKVLDFGLAKLRALSVAAGAGGSPHPSNPGLGGAPTDGNGATVTGPAHTTPGMVLGTAGYMSPEQVRGKEVDERTDIFAFGAILYEMLSGQRAFKGESSVETMNAILKEEPPELETDKLKVSLGLERIVRRCLEKEPARRFHSARDVGIALEAISGSSSGPELVRSGASALGVAAEPGGELDGGNSRRYGTVSGAVCMRAR